MFVKATLVVGAALLLADTAQPQGSPPATSATTTAKRVADSTAKAAAGSTTRTCGSGSIQIPQAFVAAVQALSGAAAANPAAVTSPMSCVRLAEAQAYMQTAAQALAARPGGAQMQVGMPPQAGGAQALAMAAAGNVANGASPAAAAGSSADMVKSGVATALAMTPQGMLVNGAVAAAPMAGSAMRAVTGRFSRGESKEGMAKDLLGGRLVVKGIRFADGADALADGADQSLTLLAGALQDVQGRFAVRLPAESDGKTPADTALARRRLERVAARLLVSGVSESRLTLVDPSTDVRKDKAPKPGDARLELIRAGEKP